MPDEIQYNVLGTVLRMCFVSGHTLGAYSPTGFTFFLRRKSVSTQRNILLPPEEVALGQCSSRGRVLFLCGGRKMFLGGNTDFLPRNFFLPPRELMKDRVPRRKVKPVGEFGPCSPKRPFQTYTNYDLISVFFDLNLYASPRSSPLGD